jgi:hypothetical protein
MCPCHHDFFLICGHLRSIQRHFQNFFPNPTSDKWSLKIFLIYLGTAFLWATPSQLRAETDRDQEIFGESSSLAPPVSPEKSPGKSQPNPLLPAADNPSQQESGAFSQNLQIGGRLDWGMSMIEKEGTARTKGDFRQLKRADIYLDSRLDENRNSSRGLRGLRGFFRLRFIEESPPSGRGSTDSTPTEVTPKTLIDEFWFKSDWRRTVFFTLGRQHLKWGSGRLWNPTDFTARESRDPFALFDARLGQDLIKAHIPFEESGHNLYFVLDNNQTQRTDDVAFLTRGEFSLGESAELALSLKKSRRGPDQLGLDWSGAIGPFDIYTETAFSRRSPKVIYQGQIGPDDSEGTPEGTFQVPLGRPENGRTFRQSVVGFQYVFKYRDGDTINGTLEYFDNELGYNTRDLELYALARGGENPLTVGRRALGLFIQAPSPGSFNDLNLSLSGIKNLIDSTATARLSATYSVFKEFSIQSYVNRCFGDYGALCFRIPEKFKSLSADTRISAEDRSILQQLPSQRTLTVVGVNLIMDI